MQHEPIEDLLALYVTGDLEPEQRARVEAWVASSPENRAALDRVEAVIRSVERAGFEEADDVPAGLDPDALLWRAVGRTRRLRLRTWSLSAAAVLLAFFAGMWVQSGLLSDRGVRTPATESADTSAPSPRARDAWRTAQRAESGFASSLAVLQALSRGDG